SLVGYFPAAVAERFPEAVRTHPLGREIVATELANTLVDEMGATFVQRVTRDTGTTVAEAARAWTIAWAVAGGATLARAIADGGFALEVETTCRLVLERTAERVTKWMLANTDPARPAAEVAAEPSAARRGGRGRPLAGAGGRGPVRGRAARTAPARAAGARGPRRRRRGEVARQGPGPDPRPARRAPHEPRRAAGRRTRAPPGGGAGV